MRFSAFLESFRIALSSLRANKLRTSLTLIGVIVGVASVIAVVTIIKGLDKVVADTFSSQGSTVFSITKQPQVILSREDAIRFNKRQDIKDDDYEAVARLCNSCWRTGVAATTIGAIKAGDKTSEGVTLRGLTLSMFEIDDIGLDAGRAWTESEQTAASAVCVIGADVVANVFDNAAPENIIGKDLRVADRTYKIIGIAETLGNLFGFSRDSLVLIPYTTYKQAFGTKRSIAIQVQVANSNLLVEAQDQVRTIMRARRGKTYNDADDGFSLESQDVFLDLYRQATANISLVVVGVAAISLVVGGIVVMNTMLVSVTERTREIGIRKALGARKKDVLQQFLIEAVMLTATGGVIGVAVGFALALTISVALDFPLLVDSVSAMLGVGVSSLVGVLSGIAPAWKAAQLDPIEALRAE